MAFKIKKQKVNRMFLYKTVTVQQQKINDLFEELHRLRGIIRNYEKSMTPYKVGE